MTSYYPLFINGEFVNTARKEKIINPANAKVIAEFAVAGKEELELAVASSRQAFDHGPWGTLSLGERKDCLLKISQGILDRATELARLETLNTGKPIKESTFMDIPSAARTFAFFANNLENYLKEESREVSSEIAKAGAGLKREPQGVVVLIVPWNYPLLIASWKMAVALAAGNTVILKPSSLTPLSALELAEIIKDCGIPRGVVNIVCAKGDEIGRLLCSDKRVDMISFTGSNEVGRRIAECSSASSKKLIMELGGKSASIVLEDADLELAVNASLCSIFLNQGQMCTAMSRLLVEEGIYDKFLQGFLAKAKQIKLGPGEDYQTQMGPLISEAQRRRVLDYVEKAQREGARVLCGGNIPQDPALREGFFFEPTVIVGITPEMTIFKEEVFGPVAAIMRFSKSEEAVSLANQSDFGLAACVWTRDIVKAQNIAAQIHAGTVWVNTYGMFFDELPYGGFKQSGFGKELGKEGFWEYTRLKNIIVDKTEGSKPLVNYWYGF